MPNERKNTIGRQRALRALALAWIAAAFAPSVLAQSAPLGTTQIRVLGLAVDVDTRPDIDGLQTDMTAVKNIPTGVTTFLGSPADGTPRDAPPGALVKAEISGPSFSDGPTTVAGAPNASLELPLIRVAGDYRLSNVRLEDADGAVLLARDPALAPIRITVIDQLLVTQVTSRPLTLDEIRDKGIVIDADNFTALNFVVGLAFGSEKVTIDFPVLVPSSQQALASPDTPQFISLGLDPEQIRRIPIPNLSLSGFAMRPPPDLDEQDKQLIPPINGVIVIAGNIAFLHQFFSVILQASNTAPDGSGLVVNAASAKIALPKGDDDIAGSGDDPLRLAETASGTHDELPLLDATGADDIDPQDTNSAEFLVEGLREGTHRVDFDLRGDLFVPALGRSVEVTGIASGVVQVKNPTFSIVLAHPQTVRSGETYSLFATVTNTSSSPANLFRLELASRSISGARLAPGQEPVRTLDSLGPGRSASFEYRLESRTTGEVTGTVFLADPGINGSFLLTTGVGDRNIPLSPDTLVLPQTVDYLPTQPDLVEAAVRLLGMAYSVATAPAGALPPNVARVSKAHVFDRAVTLAQEGLHVRLGESALVATEDLILDWFGNDRARLAELFPDDADRAAEDGDQQAFDALRRTTDAGQDLDGVLGELLGTGLSNGVADLQRDWATHAASLPPVLSLGIETHGAPVGVELRDASDARLGNLVPAAEPARDIPFASRLPLAHDADSEQDLLFVASPASQPYTVAFASPGASHLDLSLVIARASGSALLVFPGLDLAPGASGRLVVTPGTDDEPGLEVDADGDGVAERIALPLSIEPIADAPPAVVGVQQWAKGDLPETQTSFESGDPIGRMVGVLFDEEVTQATAETLANYTVAANTPVSVALQPDRRTVFLVLERPVGPFVPRDLGVQGLSDRAGQPMAASSTPIQADPDRGVGGRVSGRVVSASGDPIPFARLKYIQPLYQVSLFDCFPQDFVVAEYQADGDGRFEIEFALRDGWSPDVICDSDIWLNARNAGATNNFKLEAEDPDTGEIGRLSTRVNFDGQQIAADLILRGTASLEGRVLDEFGDIVVGGDPGTPESLPILATSLSTGEQAVGWIDADGRYAFPRSFTGANGATVDAPALQVGNISLLVLRPADGFTGVTSVNLPAAGAHVVQDVVLFAPFRYGAVSGVVYESDGHTPAANVLVHLGARALTGADSSGRSSAEALLDSTLTDSTGAFDFEHVPAGDVHVVAQRAATFEESEARGVLTEGGATELVLVMPGGGGTVRGIVRDALGNPVPGARVAGGATLTNADADGRFEIQSLPRGTVTIFGQGLDSPALGQLAVTTNGPGDVQEIVITLEPVGTITGSVFEADGVTPILAQKVQLWFKDKAVAAETFTGPDGTFAFRGFPVAKYSVRAIRARDLDGGIAQTEIRFAGDTRDADVVFRGLGTISGRVIQTNGTPDIADILVTRKVWRIIPDTSGLPIDNAALGLDVLQQFAQIPDLADSVARTIRENGLDQPRSEFFFLVDETVALRSDVLGPGGEVTGRFQFTGDATGGPFTVAALGAFLAPAEVHGEIPRTTDPARRNVDVGDIVLESATGAVQGTVFLPDGVTPAGADVLVKLRSLDSSGSVASSFGTQHEPVLPEIEATTDADGHFEFPLALRGGFVLTADTGVPDPAIAAHSPAEMQTEVFADAGGSRLLNVRLFGQTNGAVPLLPVGEFLNADVRLQDVAGARVRVVDSDGVTPVEGARVTVTTASSLDSDPDPAFTDASGEVDFFPLIEGPFSVGVSLLGSPRPGSASGLVPVDPPNGLELPITVQLGAVTTASGQVVEAAAFGSVEGTVFRADGLPLDHPAQVRVRARGADLLTSSGSDGQYRADDVPTGPFTVEVFEPFTARRGTASGTLSQDGQVLRADVTLVGLGSVVGEVFTNDGTRLLGGVDVTLSAAGDFSAPLVTRSDPSGSYSLPGVPLGPYTVRAQDFQSGLAGQTSGSLARDGDVATSDVFLEPSGRVSGIVFGPGVLVGANGEALHPDGTPFPDAPVAANAEVTIEGAAFTRTVQTDAAGRFDSGPFLRIGDYALTARTLLGDDGGSGSARVRFDGDVAFAALALQGQGSVAGVVLDSLGQTPVDGASVTLASESRFAGSPPSRITGADGRFAFPNVAAGRFSISVHTNLQDPALGGAASGELAHGEAIAFEDDDADPIHSAIRLQPAGSIAGRVVLGDGATPAAGAIALLEGGGLRLTRVADADGRIAFEGVPLGSYALGIDEPVTNGVALRQPALTANGQALDLGTIVLDADAPVVTATVPGGSATNVDSAAPIRVTWSEPVDPASVNSDSFEVSVAGVAVAGSLAFSPDGATATFTPAAPLPDVSHVDVVVRADRLGFQNEVLAAGVHDLAGNSMRADFVFSFTTADTAPPALVSISPADAAVEVDPSAVVRIEFSEPIERASIQSFTLRDSAGTDVPGALNALPILGDRVVVFTPSAPLAVNESYTATLAGPVTDRAGNAMPQAAIETRFATLDTRPPELASFALAPGALIVAGGSLATEAALVQDEPGARVEFYLNGALVDSDESAPFTHTFFLDPSLGAAAALRAVAFDAAGNRSQPRDLAIAIAANQPPQVTLLAPAPGRVSQGAQVTVKVQASDDVGLGSLRFFADDGAVAGASRAVAGVASSTQTFTFTVPSSAPAGSTIAVRGGATDTQGLSGESTAVALEVIDELAPTVTVPSPAAGALVEPGSTVDVTVRGDDSGGVAELRLSAGDFGFDQSRPVAPAASPASAVFSLPIPAGALPGSVSLVARATDAAGNVGTRIVALRVADRRAPTVSLATPSGSLAVEPASDAAVDVTAADETGVVRIELAVPGQSTQVRTLAAATSTTQPFSVAIPSDLALGATLTLNATAFDAAGNAGAATPLVLTAADLSPPDVAIAAPADGSLVAPGASFELRVHAADRFGVARVAFAASGAATASGEQLSAPAAAAVDAVFAVPVPSDAAAGQSIALDATAEDANGHAAVAHVVVHVADVVPPTVVSLDPLDGATDVDPAAVIRVVFSEAVAPASVTPTTLAVRCGGAPLAGTFGFGAGNALVSFTPDAPLANGAACSIAVTSGITDVAGNGVESAVASGFQVVLPDRTPPAVLAVEPADGATGVPLDSAVAITFSEPIAAPSVTPLSVGIREPGGAIVPASLALSADGTVATLVPNAALTAATVYRVFATQGVTDLAGNPLAAAFESSFATAGPDTRGPQLVALEPADGATGVSARPLVRACFDEPLDPASLDGGALELLDVEAGGGAIASDSHVEPGGLCAVAEVRTPLSFEHPYQVELRGTLRGVDGNAVTDPAGKPFGAIVHAFTTGSFAIVQPAAGEPVVEQTQITLEAAGSSGLGVASVVFTVNGAEQAAVSGPPFRRSFTVPSLAAADSLAITASGRDAGGVEVATAAATVSIVEGIRFEHPVTGVPLGAGALRLVASSPLRAPVDVALVANDPTVLEVPAALVFPAGASELLVPVTGLLADASTSVAATSLQGRSETSVSVSVPVAPVPGTPSFAAPVGTAVESLPSIGQVVLAPGSSQTLRVRILATPTGATTPVAITSSDPAVVDVGAAAVIAAGATEADLLLVAGAAGEARLELHAGGVGVELRVVVGAVGLDRATPSVAAPVGASVLPLPSAGELIVGPGTTRSFTIPFLDAPLAEDLAVSVSSSDPAVADVLGAVVIPAGSTSVTFALDTGAAGTAILTLRAGDVGRELRVTVGLPGPGFVPTIVAAPLGTSVLPLPSAGDLIVPAGATRSFSIGFLDAPAPQDLAVAVSSTDPAVADVQGSVVIAAGSTSATLQITTGATGTAILTLRAGGVGRELRVTVGAAAAGFLPPFVAPPVGISVLPLPSAGDLIVPVASTRSFTIPFLDAPLAQDLNVAVSSSAAAVADVSGSVVVPAGSTSVNLQLTTGSAGTAILTLRAGDVGRELRVTVGLPAAGNAPMIVAPPIGVAVLPPGTAGTLFLEPGTTRSVTLELLDFPSLGDLPVDAASRDPALVAALPATQVIPTGQRQITLTLTTGAPGESFVELRFGVDRKTLGVVVGTPAADRAPETIAPAVGVTVQQGP